MHSTWASELQRYAQDAERASPEKAASLVMRLYDLLARSPLAALVEDVERSEIARRCDLGCADAAALALTGNCGIMLSRAPRGLAIASVVLPGRDREFTASSHSIAAALCEAMAGALLEITPTAAEARTDHLAPGRS